MSRDSFLKLLLITVTIAIAAILVLCQGLYFPPADSLRPMTVTLLLVCFARFYQKRDAPGFVICLHALAQVVLFTAAYSVLMYAIAAIGFPLADHWLISLDSATGMCTTDFFEWANNNPSIRNALQLAYDSLIFQTAGIIMVLGLTNDRQPLESFVLQFMLATLVSAVVFVVVPADCPVGGYCIDPTPAQARFLEDFHSMRTGTRTLCTWRDAEGLITFPSFHTTWALLLAWSLRRRWYLFLPALFLNLAVVLSTLTTGWHYIVDVVGGVAVTGIAIWLSHLSSAWRYNANGEPRLIGVAKVTVEPRLVPIGQNAVTQDIH